MNTPSHLITWTVTPSLQITCDALVTPLNMIPVHGSCNTCMYSTMKANVYIMVCCVHYRLFHFPGVGTADTEENPQLLKVFSLKKPIVGQNIALHAQPSAKNSVFLLFAAGFGFTELHFFQALYVKTDK